MITGIIIGILATLCIVLLYDKFIKPKNKIKKLVEDMTIEEIKKEKEFKDHYKNMMNYNPAKAYEHGGKNL